MTNPLKLTPQSETLRSFQGFQDSRVCWQQEKGRQLHGQLQLLDNNGLTALTSSQNLNTTGPHDKKPSKLSRVMQVLLKIWFSSCTPMAYDPNFEYPQGAQETRNFEKPL